ncbi:MAG TPA: hypothetical protein VGH19_11415 [Verrucomicrobiae bacterium]
MMSFFKRFAGKGEEPTFKTRVKNFWKWYASVADRYYAVCETKQGTTPIAEEVSSKVNELIPGFAWVFGPGAEGKGHSFTVSGEGDIHKQFLTEYWRTQAPELKGWTFYASRQASPEPFGWRMKTGGKEFDPKEFWLEPNLNHDDKKIDVSIWHPLFDVLSEKERWHVLFLMLDEVLGEFGTQNWIGEIAFSDNRLKEAMPIAELCLFIQKVEREHEWKKCSPVESWSSYQREAGGDYPRGDIFAGSTRNLILLNEHWSAGDEMENPLPNTGADFVFVQFDRAILSAGNEVDERGRFEDAAI